MAKQLPMELRKNHCHRISIKENIKYFQKELSDVVYVKSFES